MGSKGSKTTSEQVLGEKNLEKKHFVVTGANTGLGKETVRVLYKGNATITMACRTIERMKKAKEEIEKLQKDSKGKILMLELDLSSQKKVKESIEEYKKNINLPIDVLINNAGQMANSAHTVTSDGFELRHFTFTLGLLPFIKEPGRIVHLSSFGHKFGTISFDDMDFKKRGYSPWKAYGQSKLANILFSNELNKKLKEAGKKIVSNAVHPGGIKTELGRDNTLIKKLEFASFLMKPFFKSIPQGTATTMVAAIGEKFETLGGQYLQDCDVTTNRNEESKSEEVAKKLWDLSVEKTGMKFPFGGGEKKEEKKDEIEEIEVKEEVVEVKEEEKKEQVKNEKEEKEEKEEEKKEEIVY